MIRALVILCLLFLPASSLAQEAPQPIVRTTFEQDTAIPGQPLIFRITILVPTWMPVPPVFPSFEAQNVVVRLPSRASSPTSKRVNGDTWSGVTRAYRLYPMVPGRFQVPGGPVQITYADPDTREPIVADVDVSPFEIIGKAPEIAQDLEPFLAANSLSLTRQVEGTPEDLAAGDALKITTTIKVSGVAPMFVPPMGAGDPVEGLSYYPASPALKETENRGKISGTRTEPVTIVAESAGRYQIPEQELSWYNLASGKIETASVPAIDLTVTGPAISNEPVDEPIDLKTIALNMIGLLILAGVAITLYRKFSAPVSARLHTLAEQIKASEWYAYRNFKRALGARNYSLALKTALIWRARIEARKTDTDWRAFETAAINLGAAHFGDQRQQESAKSEALWRAIGIEAAKVRKKVQKRERNRTSTSLLPLNPSSNP